MSKLRSVNTHFWSDNYIIDLDPTEKLLFLYLLTNENTNMLGIYEMHPRKISFETGIDKVMVEKIFDRFEEAGKAKYSEGYVILCNFIKNQSFNTNMKKSAVDKWNELPLEVRKDPFCEPLVKALEGFESLSKRAIRKVELEKEDERELEKEKESDGKPSNIPTLQEVKDYFTKNGYSKGAAKKFYNYYQASIEGTQKRYWRDSKGNKVRNWKQKAQAVWFKEENEQTQTYQPQIV